MRGRGRKSKTNNSRQTVRLRTGVGCKSHQIKERKISNNESIEHINNFKPELKRKFFKENSYERFSKNIKKFA